ncbi:hypothetical protein [Pontibacter vulgaris]|uniref:hypothetical protein n=1 Tax=Pontibacter vulgaris TaxID=2905679 RepID=UPI001FA7B640|nr:hypothetical protein [Pontibacter vulgaris]
MKDLYSKYKGALHASLLYLIGFGLAAVAYFSFNEAYTHGPGLSHIIVIITVLIGLFKLIPNVFKYITKSPDQLSKGAFMVHGIVAGGLLLWFLILYYEIRNPKDDIVVRGEYLITSGDTIIIADENGDTSYLRIGDKTIIDKQGIDSIK